jgi:4-hydroxyphenylpyruvate dioxygenase
LLRTASIQGYGQTLFKFVERHDYAGAFMPGYKALPDDTRSAVKPVGLAAIDHIVGNVDLGKMNYWVNWFHKTRVSARSCYRRQDEFTTSGVRPSWHPDRGR